MISRITAHKAPEDHVAFEKVWMQRRNALAVFSCSPLMFADRRCQKWQGARIPKLFNWSRFCPEGPPLKEDFGVIMNYETPTHVERFVVQFMGEETSNLPAHSLFNSEKPENLCAMVHFLPDLQCSLGKDRLLQILDLIKPMIKFLCHTWLNIVAISAKRNEISPR